MEGFVLLPEFPLLSLFLLGFTAATILPMGSEWLLIILITRGQAPVPMVLAATFGNYLGGVTTYLVGLYGAEFAMNRLFRVNKTDFEKAQTIYSRWGIWSLLLSWLPVIGDPLCLAAGVFRTNLIHFSVLVFIGKFLRYAFIAWATITATAISGAI